MDTITHTLFGVVLYRGMKKEQMSKPLQRAMLFTSLVGSQIPDIDVISQWWDAEARYQMWHRGITHSLFLVPVWAAVIALLCYLFFRVKDRRIFYLGLLAVFIHDTSDLFNAWGTGYLEPLSTMRVTFGTVPIVDLVVWGLVLGGFLVARFVRKWEPHRVFKTVGVLIAAHFLIQSTQGFVLYQQHHERYEQMELSANFVPGSFNIIGKKGDVVEISTASVFTEPQLLHSLPTATDADLERLYRENPAARTLEEWSPMIVVVDDDTRLGIYDPRFYRDGESFLFEYIEKKVEGGN